MDTKICKTFHQILLVISCSFNVVYGQEQSERNRLSVYWKQVAAIAIGCASLLIFDMCERYLSLLCYFMLNFSYCYLEHYASKHEAKKKVHNLQLLSLVETFTAM